MILLQIVKMKKRAMEMVRRDVDPSLMRAAAIELSTLRCDEVGYGNKVPGVRKAILLERLNMKRA